MMHKNAGDFWCIVEDITVPDMLERRGPKDEWGIVEGKKRRIANLTVSSENPLGDWNTMVVECVADTIKVWVNNDLVNYGYNCTATKGQIAVQAEGSEVEFRKIDLTPIEKTTPIKLYSHTGLNCNPLFMPINNFNKTRRLRLKASYDSGTKSQWY